jgi:hypothetical protein
MTGTWSKYDYLCTHCDALIEVTALDVFQPVSNITCTCGGSTALLSVVDATIQPINQTKEEKMEEVSMNNLPLSDAEKYNPDLLVTYKVIRGYSDPEYTTSKVTSLEWDLHNGRQSQKTVSVLQDKINNAKDIIAEAYSDSGDQDTLRSIAEALGIELTRTVEWTASIEVSGTIELDLLEDYDIEDEITDNLYVDSQSGRIEIGDTEVCHVREA